jgi:tetratricopeptide (TPR) repeat protein
MLIIIILLNYFSFAEDTFQDVVNRGIKLYNNEEYDRALKVFKIADKMNPNSDLVNLEFAMTYYKLKKYIYKNEKSNLIFYGIYEILISYSMEKILKDRELGESYFGLFNFRMTYDMRMLILDQERKRMDKIIQEYLKEVGGLTRLELFVNETLSLLKEIIEDDIQNQPKNNLRKDYYVPFFSELLESQYGETFCYYICHNYSEEATEWLNKSPEKVKEFFIWLKGS